MFIGRPISVAAVPLASNLEISSASTSGGRLRKIIPIGRLIRPPDAPIDNGFVALIRAPGVVGNTILCVERLDCPGWTLVGFRPVVPVRGMTIGCVVAVPAGRLDAGINPVGWGGLTVGKE